MKKKNSMTACPLDCYDACSILYDDGKIKAKRDGYTNGFLCPHLNHYENYERIKVPRYKGKEISMQEALETLQEIVKGSSPENILHYRGNGNFGLMQAVTDHFFANIGAILTDGNLCDGAGEAGIIEGRGSNKNMPIEEIAKADVIIFWGRNPHVTSSHLLPIIKGKKIIVIDPVKTKIANEADVFVQIKPHTDLYLALLLARFVSINDMLDEEFLERYASEFDEYYELTQGVRIKATLESIGVTLGDIGDILEACLEKKVAIVVGVGVQKYRDGADVLRAIDAFGVSLGLFAKEGSGIAYLGNSQEGIVSPFQTKAKRVSKVNTKFEEFETLFIQGANPLAQMPDTNRVKGALEKTKNIIYFGLYENESSEIADLVIPAKNFLEKSDIRSSYSHNALLMMHKQVETTIGISEYALANYLSKAFCIDLKSEEEYLQHYKKFGVTQGDGTVVVAGRALQPYKNGFDTDDGEFHFLEEFETEKRCGEDEFYLVTPKSPASLNSQFKRCDEVYIHPSLGYKEGSAIRIVSKSGSVVLKVKHSDDLRRDTLLIYSGTYGVNYLTNSQHSYEGKNAVFQENRVKITV